MMIRNFEFQLNQRAVMSHSALTTSGVKMEHQAGILLYKHYQRNCETFCTFFTAFMAPT